MKVDGRGVRGWGEEKGSEATEAEGCGDRGRRGERERFASAEKGASAVEVGEGFVRAKGGGGALRDR